MKKLRARFIVLISLVIVFSMLIQGFIALSQTKAYLEEEAKNTLELHSHQLEQHLQELDENVAVYEKQAFARYDQSIVNQVNSVISLIEHYHTLYKEGVLSEAEAKKSALDVIRSLRYDKNGYYWVDDMNYTSLVFPVDPTREGSNRKDWEDLTGKKMLQSLMEQVKKNGEGFEQYYFEKLDTKTVGLKRSYVKLYAPWNWVIGTGNYVGDITAEIQQYHRSLQENFKKQIEERSRHGSIAILDTKGSFLYYSKDDSNSNKATLRDAKTKQLITERVLKQKNGFFEYTVVDPITNTPVEKLVYVKHEPRKERYIFISRNKNSVYKSVRFISEYLYKDFILWTLTLLIVTLYFIILRKKAATRDYLTNLYNREKIKELLDRKILQKEKGKLYGDIFFLIFDVNAFSYINNRYGTYFGDLVLQRISELLMKFHDKAYIARTKGDDFFILLKETNWNKANETAQNLFDSLNDQTFEINGVSIKIKINAIFTKWTRVMEDAGNIMSLLEKNILLLEDNMVEKKLHIFEDLDRLVAVKENKTEDINTLLEILENDRIVPFFQPIYNIQDNHIEKYEVLMRIKTETGYEPPSQYILAAERNNLIQQLDQVVIHKALQYKKEINSDMHLSINISGKEMEEAFLDKIWNWVNVYHINPKEITLELTETSAIKNIEEVSLLISKFKQKGFCFALDDFGTGFSGIQYLRDLPVDFVKIDGSFIKNIDQDQKNYYLVKSLTSMAKAFDTKVVAEFVENKNIFNLLKDIEIEYAQGYFIGKPCPDFLHDGGAVL